LAVRQEAELVGLFIEDTDLLNLAALPFAREVGLSSTPRPMDPMTTASEIRAQAAVAQRRLAVVAQDVGLNWSFEIRRGRYEPEVLAALAGADLLVLDRSRKEDVAERLGLAARVLSADSPPSVLLLGPNAEALQSGPVAVRYDESPGAASALAAAARIVGRDDRPIIVLLEAQEKGALREQERIVLSKLESLDLTGSIRRLSRPGPTAVAQVLRADHVRLLAMGVSEPPSLTRLMADLADVSHTSILLMRSPATREDLPKERE
jgi:hypothetical protein